LNWAVADIGLPLGAAQVNKARVRNCWDALTPRQLFGVCRTTAKTNWFLTWALRLKQVFYGSGFRFESKEAREWTHRRKGDDVARRFDWAATMNDVWRELVVQDNCIVFWRRREDRDQALPLLNVVPCEGVTYSSVLSDEVLKIHLKQRLVRDLDEGFRERHGERYYQAVVSGKPLEIKSWEDEEFDFRVFTRGKRGSGMETPSMVSILDDLEYLELIRVGDYNAALKRKDFIRQTKKGYAVGNGPLSGQNVHHLKRTQKTAIQGAMQDISGAADLTTNFDIGIEFPHVPAEFFNDMTSRSAMRRLMNWGGFATLLLQEGLSRIHGVSPYLMNVTRAEVFHTRDLVADFMQGIFESDSFLGTALGTAPDLRPIWSNSMLYTFEEYVPVINAMMTHGLASPQTIRERYLDLDEEQESELMKQAHEDRQRYTPPHESRQGLLEKLFPQDYHTSETGTTASPKDGGDGGNPKAEP
jgi:hypothetical protein